MALKFNYKEILNELAKENNQIQYTAERRKNATAICAGGAGVGFVHEEFLPGAGAEASGRAGERSGTAPEGAGRMEGKGAEHGDERHAL